MSPALVDGRCKEYLESETIVTLTYWLSKRRFRYNRGNKGKTNSAGS